MGQYIKLSTDMMHTVAMLALVDGLNHPLIEKKTGIPRRSISHFLQRKNANTHDFWKTWDALENDPETRARMQELRIFIYDIETSPMRGYFWGLFKQNIGLNQIDNDWFVLTWAGKWYGQDHIYSDTCWNHNFEVGADTTRNPQDREVIQSLWDMFDQADIIIGHNGNRFDIKKVTARAILLGIQPHKPVRKIDTMLIAKAVGMFTSNKLEYLVDKICGGAKLPTGGFGLWTGCLEGDEGSWAKMLAYNKGDVVALEQVWVRLAPYDKRAPNLLCYTDDTHARCMSPACGSDDVVATGHFVTTNVSKFPGYKCNTCGFQMRSRVSVRTKAQKEVTFAHAL